MTPTYAELYEVQASAMGKAAQARVRRASVALIGLGGIGGHVATTLAAAGVGELILVDPQPTEASNFNRLGVTRTEHIGRPKTELFMELLGRRPHLKVSAVREKGESEIAQRTWARADAVVTASNTVASRISAARMTAANKQIHVCAGVGDARFRRSGTVTIWHPERADLACGACLLTARRMRHGDALLGSVTALVGVLAAHVVVHALARPQAAEALWGGNIVTLDLRTYQMQALTVAKNPACRACGNLSAIKGGEPWHASS